MVSTSLIIEKLLYWENAVDLLKMYRVILSSVSEESAGISQYSSFSIIKLVLTILQLSYLGEFEM